MARHHLINGNIVPFTAQEEAEWDANEAAYADGAFDRAMADLRSRRNNKSKKGFRKFCSWKNINLRKTP